MGKRALWLAVLVLVAMLRVAAAQTCGDGVVDPGEQCDLGPANCPAGVCCDSSCNANCELLGRCTGTDGCCTSDAQCPSGEGCCGSGVVAGDEQCDDGNLIDGDCCSSRCQVEAAPCVPLPSACGLLGPQNVISNPAIRPMRLRDRPPVDGMFNRWLLRMKFGLPDWLMIDPASEQVQIILSENDGTGQSQELYHSSVDPGSFRTRLRDRIWIFRLGVFAPDLISAPGLRLERFRHTLRLPRFLTHYAVVENVSIPRPQLLNGVRRVRLSMVAGEVCVSRLLDCQRRDPYPSLLCEEIHCGDGEIQRTEECGEPGLPACSGGNVCDSCRCLPPVP